MKKIIKEITPKKNLDKQDNRKKRVAAYARVSTEQDERLHSLQVKKIITMNILKVILIGN